MLSVFDLDGTLISGNSSFHFGRFLYKEALLSKSRMVRLVAAYLCHRCHYLTLESLHHEAFHLFFQGRQRVQLDALVTRFLDASLPDFWYVPALQALRDAQAAGHQVAIFSSSPDFLVRAFAERLNVDQWRSSVYPLDSLGYLNVAPLILSGANKATLLDELASACTVHPRQTIAYSDSIHDLPFLLKAGRPVAVKPDRALRSVCKQNNWEVV